MAPAQPHNEELESLPTQTIDLATFNNRHRLSVSTYQNLTDLGDIHYRSLCSAQGGETSNGCAYLSAAAAIGWVQSRGIPLSVIEDIIFNQAGPHLQIIRRGAEGRFVGLGEVTNYLSEINFMNECTFEDTIVGDMGDDSFIDQMVSGLEVKGEFRSVCKYLLFASVFTT